MTPGSNAYKNLHARITRRLGKASKCVRCALPAKKYEWSNTSGRYLDDDNDWEPLCVSCHRKKDYRGGNKGRVMSTEWIAKIAANSFHGNQTHCKNGHPFDETNTRYLKPNNYYKNGKRECRACCRTRDRLRRPRKQLTQGV